MLFQKKTITQKLRELSGWGMQELPETLRVPPQGAHRPQEQFVAIEKATLDELAFAIVGIEVQVAQARRGLSGLRELYEQARKRGAAGTNTVAEVFFSGDFTEVAK